MRHSLYGKALFEYFPALCAVHFVNALRRLYRLVLIFNDESGNALFHDFRNRAMAIGDDRRTAGEGFDHDHAERFRPVNRKQQGTRITQKAVFFLLIDFAYEIDQRMAQQRLDCFIEITFIHLIDFGGDAQRRIAAQGNFYCPVEPLFRGDATNKHKVIFRRRIKPVKISRQAMMNRFQPVDPRQRNPLSIRD